MQSIFVSSLVEFCFVIEVLIFPLQHISDKNEIKQQTLLIIALSELSPNFKEFSSHFCSDECPEICVSCGCSMSPL